MFGKFVVRTNTIFIYLQLNKHIKTINGHCPTDNRISWTTEGLNIFLEIYRDFFNLCISKRDGGIKFVEGTMEDVNKLWLLIFRKFGVVTAPRATPWDPDCLYPGERRELRDLLEPSLALEKAHGGVIKLYAKQQNSAWDNAAEFVIVGNTQPGSPPPDAADFMDLDDREIEAALEQPSDGDNSEKDAGANNNNDVEDMITEEEINKLDNDDNNEASDREDIDEDEDLPDIDDF